MAICSILIVVYVVPLLAVLHAHPLGEYIGLLKSFPAVRSSSSNTTIALPNGIDCYGPADWFHVDRTSLAACNPILWRMRNYEPYYKAQTWKAGKSPTIPPFPKGPPFDFHRKGSPFSCGIDIGPYTGGFVDSFSWNDVKMLVQNIFEECQQGHGGKARVGLRGGWLIKALSWHEEVLESNGSPNISLGDVTTYQSSVTARSPALLEEGAKQMPRSNPATGALSNVAAREPVCFGPDIPGISKTSINDCRALLTAMRHEIPNYRKIQKFEWNKTPEPNGPPYQFTKGHTNCEVNITAANIRVISYFSFERARNLAQDILQDCNDKGAHFGGWIPVQEGFDEGWRVEVTGSREIAGISAKETILNSALSNSSFTS